jgi:exopolyphosphatase/guanosine-5'-triphosphate,3'-diphosphate pyrophosphatase
VRCAVIDIGTNTLLLLVVDLAPGRRPKPVVDLCRFGRLGQGLDRTGQLAPEAIARSLEFCREYRQVLDQLAIGVPFVVGTQALREATNAAEFIAPAETILGAPIEIIAGEREAELAFAAVAATFPELSGAPYVVMDVGGGSTELIHTDGSRVVSAVSVPIGAVRLAERHFHHDPPTAADAVALATDIDRVLAPLALPRGVPVIGTAGTATTLATVELQLPGYDSEKVTGLRLTPAAVQARLAGLLAMTVAERRGVPGMVVERADVLPAGIAIIAGVLARVEATELIVCDRGIRWGVALSAAPGPGGTA